MQITRAEVKIANLLVQHDIPLAITDHLNPIFKDMLPDIEAEANGTLASILTNKLANPEPCHKYEPKKVVLETAKKATMEYNRAHQQSTSS